jgi:hypothetical protein
MEKDAEWVAASKGSTFRKQETHARVRRKGVEDHVLRKVMSSVRRSQGRQMAPTLPAVLLSFPSCRGWPVELGRRMRKRVA